MVSSAPPPKRLLQDPGADLCPLIEVHAGMIARAAGRFPLAVWVPALQEAFRTAGGTLLEQQLRSEDLTNLRRDYPSVAELCRDIRTLAGQLQMLSALLERIPATVDDGPLRVHFGAVGDLLTLTALVDGEQEFSGPVVARAVNAALSAAVAAAAGR